MNQIRVHGGWGEKDQAVYFSDGQRTAAIDVNANIIIVNRKINIWIIFIYPKILQW